METCLYLNINAVLISFTALLNSRNDNPQTILPSPFEKKSFCWTLHFSLPMTQSTSLLPFVQTSCSSDLHLMPIASGISIKAFPLSHQKMLWPCFYCKQRNKSKISNFQSWALNLTTLTQYGYGIHENLDFMF